MRRWRALTLILVSSESHKDRPVCVCVFLRGCVVAVVLVSLCGVFGVCGVWGRRVSMRLVEREMR